MYFYMYTGIQNVTVAVLEKSFILNDKNNLSSNTAHHDSIDNNNHIDSSNKVDNDDNSNISNDDNGNNDDDNLMAANILDISEICCGVLITMIESINDIGSILCLYNISCRTYGLKVLTEKKIHLKILKFLSFSMDLETNCAYLRLLVQMCTCSDCVSELYEHGLIDILNKILDKNDKSSSIKIKNDDITERTEKTDDDNDDNDYYNDEDIIRNKHIEILNSDISRCLIAIVRTCVRLHRKSSVLLTVIINRIIPDMDSERTDESKY
jgi:hypothetical protein